MRLLHQHLFTKHMMVMDSDEFAKNSAKKDAKKELGLDGKVVVSLKGHKATL